MYQNAGDWTWMVKKRRHFCDAIYTLYNASFYQDRLGTNIGKS
eukprot:COSAG06_NODE_797_length_12213_cov_7.037382_6_plen_43_part_00